MLMYEIFLYKVLTCKVLKYDVLVSLYEVFMYEVLVSLYEVLIMRC